MRSTLDRHLGRAVVDTVLSGVRQADGQSADITAMFIDVRGFTKLSAEQDSQEVFSALREFYDRTIKVVESHGGLLNKFFGDGAFAFWGAPLPMVDHALMALRAAIALQESLRKLEQDRVASGTFGLKVSIGIHSGLALVGEMGNEERADFTAFGSTVNMAARIEAKTRDFGVSILVSQETARRIGSAVTLVRIGACQLKGFEGDCAVFGLDSERGEVVSIPAGITGLM
jgi:adenylate cyclase